MKPITHSEYKLRLNYGSIIGPGPTDVYCDITTQTALLNLYTHNRISCTQPDSTTLVFETQRDRMLAVLALSNAKEYTTECID